MMQYIFFVLFCLFCSKAIQSAFIGDTPIKILILDVRGILVSEVPIIAPVVEQCTENTIKNNDHYAISFLGWNIL